MPEIKILDTEPTINRLQVMPDGRIWIATNRGIREVEEGVMMRFDVFSSMGEFERQVDIVAEADGLSDLLFLVDEEHAVLIRGFWQSLVPETDEEEDSEPAVPVSVTFCKLKS
jgi:hypothetical protein